MSTPVVPRSTIISDFNTPSSKIFSKSTRSFESMKTFVLVIASRCCSR